MKKITVALISLLLTGLLVAPASAQERSSPIVEVVPVEFDRPLPTVDVPGTPRDETVVLGTPLARTGLDVTVGILLGIGLMVAGGGALLLARGRRRTAVS